MSTHPRYWLGSLLGLLVFASIAAAQSPIYVPIGGFTGTISPAINVDEFYDGANKILEKVGDGLDNGRKAPSRVDDDGVLEHMRPGTAVAVSYLVNGIQSSGESGLNEGVITSVDRRKEEIAIRYTNGETDLLRLTEHPSHAGRVIVYYPDASGQKIPYYFKPAK